MGGSRAHSSNCSVPRRCRDEFQDAVDRYLQRFIGDLVTRSSQIAELLIDLKPLERAFLQIAAERDARNAAPGDAATDAEAVDIRLIAWNERWAGLTRWFVSDGRDRAQAELLRASALSAIPRLLQAVSLLHERRAGRSDRAADFRRLALWFAAAGGDGNAHRLWRTAFALSPGATSGIGGRRRESQCEYTMARLAGIAVLPKLREQGVLPTRGAPPRIHDRSLERNLLGARVAAEAAQTEAARQRLATNRDNPAVRVGSTRFVVVSAVPDTAGRGSRQPDGSRRARGTVDRRWHADRGGSFLSLPTPRQRLQRTWGPSAVAIMSFSFVEPSACQPPDSRTF